MRRMIDFEDWLRGVKVGAISAAIIVSLLWLIVLLVVL